MGSNVGQTDGEGGKIRGGEGKEDKGGGGEQRIHWELTGNRCRTTTSEGP